MYQKPKVVFVPVAEPVWNVTADELHKKETITAACLKMAIEIAVERKEVRSATHYNNYYYYYTTVLEGARQKEKTTPHS